MADPSFLDLLTAPLRALLRAQRTLSSVLLEWVRRVFPPDNEGIGEPHKLALPVHDPTDRIRGVSVPAAVLTPPPDLSITVATVELDLGLVQTRATTTRTGRQGLAFVARPVPAATRRTNRRAVVFHVEMQLRAVPPGPAVEAIQRRLSEPTRWRGQSPRPRPRP